MTHEVKMSMDDDNGNNYHLRSSTVATELICVVSMNFSVWNVPPKAT